MDSRAKRRLKHRSGADLVNSLSSEIVRAVIPGIEQRADADLDVDVTGGVDEPDPESAGPSNARRLKTFGLTVSVF